jgi:hypothetical protein
MCKWYATVRLGSYGRVRSARGRHKLLYSRNAERTSGLAQVPWYGTRHPCGGVPRRSLTTPVLPARPDRALIRLREHWRSCETSCVCLLRCDDIEEWAVQPQIRAAAYASATAHRQLWLPCFVVPSRQESLNGSDAHLCRRGVVCVVLRTAAKLPSLLVFVPATTLEIAFFVTSIMQSVQGQAWAL